VEAVADSVMVALIKHGWFQANKNHPEFATTYQNTLQRITVDFSVLEVLLHQEALLSTMEMMMTIQQAVERSKPPSNVQPAVQRRQSVVSSTVSSTVKKIAPKRGLKFHMLYGDTHTMY